MPAPDDCLPNLDECMPAPDDYMPAPVTCRPAPATCLPALDEDPEDEAVEDESLEDEGPEDEAVEDESPEDEAVEDKGPEEEAVEDEGLEEEAVKNGDRGPPRTSTFPSVSVVDAEGRSGRGSRRGSKSSMLCEAAQDQLSHLQLSRVRGDQLGDGVKRRLRQQG